MQLSQLITQLATKFDSQSLAPLANDPDILQAQFATNHETVGPAQTVLLRPHAPRKVRLCYGDQAVAVVTLGPQTATVATIQNQLLQLLLMIGKLVRPATTALITINQLAITAITADFDAVLQQTVQLLGNPVAIIDLNGQVLSRSHTTALNGASIQTAVTQNQIGRWLLEHGFATNKTDFSTQIYVAHDKLSSVPMLITPLAANQEPLGYLVMPALKTPLSACHALLINDLGKVIAGSLVKNQVLPTATAQHDRLLNMLLTERQSTTFAAQFEKQQVALPTAMVFLKCEPLTGQSPVVLQQRLRYLLAPAFKTVLITIHQQQCVALLSLSLADYNSPQFKQRLQKLTIQADCRLIVSNFYQHPADTFAAYTVCERTAQLKTYRGRVVFCEDEFYNLALARVNHLEILPFFINPALKGLLDYDAQHETELVATLDAYLMATCHLTRTAEQLYVHPNTLRNRLKHISEITGCDLRDANTCFKLASAFKLQRYLERNNYTPTVVPTDDPEPTGN